MKTTEKQKVNEIRDHLMKAYDLAGTLRDETQDAVLYHSLNECMHEIAKADVPMFNITRK